jgi:hypothetical protein
MSSPAPVSIPPIRAEYQGSCNVAREEFSVTLARVDGIDESIRQLERLQLQAGALKTAHLIEDWDTIIEAPHQVEVSMFPRTDEDERRSAMYGGALLRARLVRRPLFVLDAAEAQLKIFEAEKRKLDAFADDVDEQEMAALAPHVAVLGTSVFPRDLPSRAVREFASKLARIIETLAGDCQRARDKGSPNGQDVLFFDRDAISDFDLELLMRSK